MACDNFVFVTIVALDCELSQEDDEEHENRDLKITLVSAIRGEIHGSKKYISE